MYQLRQTAYSPTVNELKALETKYAEAIWMLWRVT